MGYIFSYLKPYRKRMIYGVTIKIIGTLMGLVLPWILAYIIDEVVPKKDMKEIYLWGGIMIFCALIGVFSNIYANRLAAKVARESTRKIRHDLFSKMMNLSQSQVDQETIPSLIYKMSSDTYNVYQMIGMMQRIAVRAPILLVGGIILTLTLDAVLTLVLVATLPFIGFIAFNTSMKSVGLFNDLQVANDKVIQSVRENATGIRVVKALSNEDDEIKRFDEINNTSMKKGKKANMTMALVNPALTLLLNIGIVGIVLLGAYRVDQGNLAPGKIVAFLSYVTIILNAMMTITRIFIMYSRASASATRIKKIMLLDDLLPILDIPKEKSDYHIEFRHVDFSYLKVENNLNDIDFKIKRGQSLGVIGATGSGKTTIINLLMRFYDVDNGAILIDGIDIRSIKLDNLRKKFGVVFQNDTIFSDTVYQNIDFGRHLEFDEVINASKKAQASEFIEELEDYYQTVLAARGTNLSGGQKQRILISRALASTDEILILDDSSSALDYQTDAKLRGCLNDENITKIIIAQRISSIQSCDFILVLDEGKIVNSGTHEELLNNSQIYQLIAKTQMGVRE